MGPMDLSMPDTSGPPVWDVNKAAVTSSGGIVSAQNWLAAQAGADILARGGNAVDAGIATAFALGVAEPWLSGIGGCGFMMIYRAADQKVFAVDFSTVSPRNLDPADYTVVDDESVDWFHWPSVLEDRNLIGYPSICVPGTVAGLGLAHQEFGKLSWSDLLSPAITLAERGLLVDWFTVLCIAIDGRGLERFPASREIFLPQGNPPVCNDASEGSRHLPLGRLPATLRRLAEHGPQEFYEGQIAADLIADLAAGGSVLDAADLAAYRANIVEPLAMDYRDATLHAVPGLCGGPTFMATMAKLKDALPAPCDLTPETVAAQARALHDTLQDRLATLGHGHDAGPESCTTHTSIIDAAGNMVSLTNTLLSRFGSKVVLPKTGILMNNGLMWFDPRGGRPNSIAAGVRPLANMNPILATRNGQPLFAIGGAGGRQIVPAVSQLASYVLDCGMSLEEAFRWPRFDINLRAVVCSTRLPARYLEKLAKQFSVARVEDTLYPVLFANPSAIMRDPATGKSVGMAHINSPWSAVVAAETS